MSEPNPYEPPHEPEPLRPVQVLKRGLGVATILLLMPVAVIITGVASCSVGVAYIDSYYPQGASPVDALAIFLIPPILVFAGMTGWAATRFFRLRKTQRDSPRQDAGHT